MSDEGLRSSVRAADHEENPACKPLCLECMLKTDGEFSMKRPSNADIISDLNGSN